MNQDEVGLADLVATESGVEVPKTEAPEPTPEVTTPVVETKQEEATPPAPAEQQTTEGETEKVETPAPSQEQKVEEPAIDWTQFIPSSTAEVTEPLPDENGQVNSQEYARYVIEQAKAELRREGASREAVLKGVEQAESILPEMKTNTKIATLVQNTAIAQTVKGQAPDFAGAAQTIKDLLGETRTEANNNAKVSITTQKNAAVETGASTRGSEPGKGQAIADRINSGDNDAIVELLDLWSEQGVV